MQTYVSNKLKETIIRNLLSFEEINMLSKSILFKTYVPLRNISPEHFGNRGLFDVLILTSKIR